MNHKSCFNGFIPDSILYFSSIWYWIFHDRNRILRTYRPTHSVFSLIFSVASISSLILVFALLLSCPTFIMVFPTFRIKLKVLQGPNDLAPSCFSSYLHHYPFTQCTSAKLASLLFLSQEC